MGSLRVLVAEDHPVNRQYMAALLEGMGHQPFFAGNGLEAVQAIREQRFDIVLMDLHMPLLDGVGATLSIRALPDGAAATVPIIALTADAFAQTRERCLMAGMNDFLAKPVSPERLSAMFRRLFGGAGSADAAATGLADAPAPEPAPLVLDRATLDAALRAMSRERLAHLLRSFFDQGPEMVERLRVALRDGQALDLRVNAHAARGAALNFGLSALAQTAQALHEGATHVPAHEIARLIQRFEQLLAASREACEAAGLLDARSQNDRLGLQPDAEAAVDAFLDGAGQRQHLGADGAAAVHQHQRLALVDAGLADGLALPAAGVDQPAGGQLDAAVGQRVVHHRRVAADDVAALLGADHRVLEEAAGIADQRRVGQLGAADRADPVEDRSARRAGRCRCRARAFAGPGSPAPAATAAAGASARA